MSLRNMHSPVTDVSEERLPVIVIHGGAGTLVRSAMSATLEADYRAALESVLLAGQAVLAAGGSALDAVTEAVRLLEECPLFNAGKGSVLTEDGTHELDAAVMDGASLAAGAVTGVTTLRNPILAARQVMAQGEHVLLAGAGAERFAASRGCETVSNDFFTTDARDLQWKKARAEHIALGGADAQGRVGMLLDHDAQSRVSSVEGRHESEPEAASTGPQPPIDPDTKFGTVGAVACDAFGNIAAATSTGGMTNKRIGRIGDSPLIGAGCYANNATCAVSATGTGEAFIRLVAGHDVSARIEYGHASTEMAAQQFISEKLGPLGGRGGLIVVDAKGTVTMPFNTEGMYRGFARVGALPVTAIYGDERDDC